MADSHAKTRLAQFKKLLKQKGLVPTERMAYMREVERLEKEIKTQEDQEQTLPLQHQLEGVENFAKENFSKLSNDFQLHQSIIKPKFFKDTQANILLKSLNLSHGDLLILTYAAYLSQHLGNYAPLNEIKNLLAERQAEVSKPKKAPENYSLFPSENGKLDL